MALEIIHELTSVSDTTSVRTEQVLACVRRVDTQGAQNAILGNLKESKEFDVVRSHKPFIKLIKIQKTLERQNYKSQMRHKQKCKYCGCSHPPDNVLLTERHAGNAGSLITFN